LLSGLTKTVLETALEAEMTQHLGYEGHDPVPGSHTDRPVVGGRGQRPSISRRPACRRPALLARASARSPMHPRPAPGHGRCAALRRPAEHNHRYPVAHGSQMLRAGPGDGAVATAGDPPGRADTAFSAVVGHAHSSTPFSSMTPESADRHHWLHEGTRRPGRRSSPRTRRGSPSQTPAGAAACPPQRSDRVGTS
jgi:hypothetical protein